mmetsp:Transcript_48897/g.72653  ORF Transcript_48897/g.72653 Transcript_48897/m.72653 type:complete len:208 (-) Transcript_48897:73-696(-)
MSDKVLYFAGKAPSSTVPDAILADLKKLKSLKPPQLDMIVGAVLAFMSSPASYDFASATSEISSSLKVSGSVLKNIFKALILFFKGALKHGVSTANVKADLMNCGVKEAGATHIAAMWAKVLPTVSRIVSQAQLEVNELEDMQWKFGVTAASDEMRRVGSTFLQLKLTVGKGESKQRVNLEMTLPQFYDFLAQMEKVRSTMDFVSQP